MVVGTKEAARILGFSQQHVTYLIRKGVIKAQKIGHDHAIDVKDLRKIKRLRSSKNGEK